MPTDLLLLGFALGLLSILAPGPVTLTLFEVGVAQGRHRGTQGGLGIAAGDAVAALAAATLVLAGSALPTPLFAAVGLASSAALVALGLGMALRPAAVRALALGVRHPARALFLLTALTPSVLGAWVAVIGAMPFAHDRGAVAVFTLGGILASVTWHPLLGATAGTVGSRLDPATLALLTRVGGAALAALGVATLVG